VVKFADVLEILATSIFKAITILILEAATTYKTPVNFYQTPLLSIPEDGHTCRRENLKFASNFSVYHYKVGELIFSTNMSFKVNNWGIILKYLSIICKLLNSGQMDG
jgi:hypothetical protein